MTKPTTNTLIQAKTSTNSTPDSSVPTNSTRSSKASTDTIGNPAYDAARTLYGAHLSYNDHIYYIGRDPDLVPGSDRARTNSTLTIKVTTSVATP